MVEAVRLPLWIRGQTTACTAQVTQALLLRGTRVWAGRLGARSGWSCNSPLGGDFV